MPANLPWIIWVTATLLTFGALEAWALLSDRPTLSATLRRWLGIRPPRPWRHVATLALVAGLAWLGIHLTTGWV